MIMLKYTDKNSVRWNEAAVYDACHLARKHDSFIQTVVAI